MKKYIITIIITIGIVAFFIFSSSDDKREIEFLIDKVIEAVRKKDLEGVMEYFSIHYRDEYGGTYPIVKNVIKNHFSKYDSFDIDYTNLETSIDERESGEKRAIVNIDIKVFGIRSNIPEPIIGNINSSENVIITLDKPDLGGWKIKSVHGLSDDEMGL